MAKLVALALCLASAAGFAPAPSQRSRTLATQATLNGWTPDESQFAYGLPGALDPVGNFDPAGFTERASLEEMKMYREAEVTHGRVAMLATVGFIAQERAHFLFVEPDKDIGPAIRHLDEVRAVNPVFFEGLTFTIALAELYRGACARVSCARSRFSRSAVSRAFHVRSALRLGEADGEGPRAQPPPLGRLLPG